MVGAPYPTLADSVETFRLGRPTDTVCRPLATGELDQLVSRSDITVIGERHERVKDHAFEEYILQHIVTTPASVAIALEMLPPSGNETLNSWSRGQLSEHEFLKKSEWTRSWGYSFDLYRSIFELARAKNIGLYGINSKTFDDLDALEIEVASTESRHQSPLTLTQASRDYRSILMAYAYSHGFTTSEVIEQFVKTQLARERVLAAHLSKLAQLQGRKVLAVVGRGHVMFGSSLPAHLRSLGYDTLIIVPTRCTRIDPFHDPVPNFVCLCGRSEP